jgi:hypothetical protein
MAVCMVCIYSNIEILRQFGVFILYIYYKGVCDTFGEYNGVP